MATDTTATGPTWEIITTHDWSEPAGIETSLLAALDQLDDEGFSGTLYDYIDLDAVMQVFEPTAGDRGASEIRFQYRQYDVRITNDGHIEARR